MLTRPLNHRTLAWVQELIEANYSGRDELYTAAEWMNDNVRKRICRRLADRLADNAIELEQIIVASGADPPEPIDVHDFACGLFDSAKADEGETGVLRTAAEIECDLKSEYERAIGDTSDPEAKALLARQREEVEFIEQILRNLKADAVT